MSATAENIRKSGQQKSSGVKKLAIIAGGGELPEILVKSCKDQDIETFIVILEGQGNEDIICDQHHMIARIGEAGKIIDTLKSYEFSDIVLIGSIKKPSLSDLKPDLKRWVYCPWRT